MNKCFEGKKRTEGVEAHLGELGLVVAVDLEVVRHLGVPAHVLHHDRAHLDDDARARTHGGQGLEVRKEGREGGYIDRSIDTQRYKGCQAEEAEAKRGRTFSEYSPYMRTTRAEAARGALKGVGGRKAMAGAARRAKRASTRMIEGWWRGLESVCGCRCRQGGK